MNSTLSVPFVATLVLLALFVAADLAKSFQIPMRIAPPSGRNYRRKASFRCHDRNHWNRECPPFRVSSSSHTTTLRRSSSRVFSFRDLVDDIDSSAASGDPKVVFVGGKGGTGKTSISSALAVSLASSYDTDHKVLIVSTDPAHSLGDALDEDLRVGKGKPVLMTDPLTGGRLHACEIDTEKALDDFRRSLAAFDLNRLADALGVSTELLESFGLREFSSLLNNPPPGLDELVALSNVLDPKSAAADFDVVVVDTAPTGHTLRLLALPQFLDGLLGKLINLRLKLSGLASTLQAFFGSEEAQKRAKSIDDAVDKLEQFRTRMSNLRGRLQNRKKTNFVVVSIPTKLSVAESKRLMGELTSQDVAVTDLVVNQCVGEIGEDSSEAMTNYYERRLSGQQRWLEELQGAIDKVGKSKEYRNNGSSDPIGLTRVPFFDVELVGVPALAYVGRECYINNNDFSHLMQGDYSSDNPRVVICGGKGGVGKTTTSSALAVSMAAEGHNVALISTDPAHSLGDAIDMNLSGGEIVDCPLLGVNPTDGSLSVLEIDPTKALGQFKNVVDQLIGKREESAGAGGGGGGGGGELANTLKEFGEIFDTLPAGTDEVVALAKVINLVKKGNYDRVVLDTAPTGHTLRMLSTPGFLADLIEKVLFLAEKVKSNSAVQMLVNSAAGANSERLSEAAEKAKSTLLQFQLQMWDLEDMFSNPDMTEFVIVTVPTELAVRESVRLLNDLTFEAPDMPIKVRNVVANQVLRDDGEDVGAFLSHVREGQNTAIQDLQVSTQSMSRPPKMTEVPYLDTEPRGVFGLKVLAEELLREDSRIVEVTQQ